MRFRLLSRPFRSLVATALAILPALAAIAEPAGLRIQGELRDTGGRPAAGAMVRFRAGDPAHGLSVFADEAGVFRSPVLPNAGPWDVRVRRIGWKDLHVTATASDPAPPLALLLQREDDPAQLAAQLPANRWYQLVLERLEDPRQREELKRQCTYCHQQGSEATRVVRDEEQWRKLLALMGRMGGMLSTDLRERLPALFMEAYQPARAVAALTARMHEPDFEPPPQSEARRAVIEDWELGDRASMQHDVTMHPDGRLYSVDMSHDRLYRLDPRAPGGARATWQIPRGDLPLGGVFASVGSPQPPTSNAHVGPHSLQVAPDGAIWITLALGNQLARFDPASERFEVVPLRHGYYPHTLRFDARGRIWYTIAASNHLGMYDPATQEQRELRLPARDLGQAVVLRMLPMLLWLNRHVDLRGAAAESDGVSMPVPYGVDVAPDGSVWFSQLNEHRIGRVDPESFAIEMIDTPFAAPRRLRFDADGRLWIPSFSDSLIARFDPKTRVFERWELPIEPRGSETPYALHVDPASGAVWICGTNSDTLIRFEPASERFTVYPLPTRVTYTREIAFDAEGRVWTSNSNSPAWQIEGGMPQVLRLDPDGEAVRLAASDSPTAAGPALVNSARLRLAARALRALAGLATLAVVGIGCGPSDAPVDDSGPVAGWPAWGGDAGGSRHSPLTQITRENVDRLELAWRFHTGDVADGSQTRGKSVFEATPILDGDTLYFCSPFNRVFALDAETGRQRWAFDPKVELAHLWQLTCRGVALWSDASRDAGESCRRRIFTGTVDGRLLALDAEDGALCRDFGEGGSVDLTQGLGELLPGEYGVTSPPTLIGDVVAVGALVGDGRRTDAPSGVVRGFDARSGALRWAFDPVPPGTPPLPPAADGTPRWRPGTPNAWSVFSADPARDLLFVPMGNASPDFYGGLRSGLDYFSSSLVALRGSTGEVVWRFQTVHHDLWDYDVSSQPTLIELHREGRALPVVAQATKMGHLFLLDRETGAPVFPVEERPVPQDGGPGEELSPTQPFPTVPPPLHPPGLSPEDAWGLTPWDRGKCRKKIAASRSEGIFTPPSLRGSVQFPGVAGGFNWGGVAFDPARRLLVANTNRMANLVTLVPSERLASVVRDEQVRRGVHPQLGAPFATTVDVLVSPLGIPCTKPPWGTLLALEIETGRVVWEVPFGSTRDLAPFPFWLDWGLPSMGGPLLTASGVVFIGAAMDDYLRAYDVETGALLWKARLPAGGQATPMTYRLRPDSRQFVVIAAGGHGTMGTTQGDALLAFRLP